MAKIKDLESRLEQIRSVFNIDEIKRLNTNKNYIKKYYRASKIGYSLFYSSNAADQMYMGISRDGKFKESDLLEAARTVEKYIKKLKASHILELATGRGASSSYLAGKYTDISFDGIELSPAQLGFARKKSKLLQNYHPVEGDYHDLKRYPDNRFDIVFVIEALCYSTDKSKVYSEVNRVLRDGGIFIVFDGYAEKPRKRMTKLELTACQLTEKSMALSVFEDYGQAISKANQSGLKVIHDENVSRYIQPTLRRFERHAVRYFRFPKTAKTINAFVPKKFIYNVIAALLMPVIVDGRLLSYHITIMKKV